MLLWSISIPNFTCLVEMVHYLFRSKIKIKFKHPPYFKKNITFTIRTSFLWTFQHTHFYDAALKAVILVKWKCHQKCNHIWALDIMACFFLIKIYFGEQLFYWSSNISFHAWIIYSSVFEIIFICIFNMFPPFISAVSGSDRPPNHTPATEKLPQKQGEILRVCSTIS